MSSSSFQITQKLMVDNRIELREYCGIALDIWRRAAFFREVKDTTSLYVTLLTFSSLVSEVIQCHQDYRPYASFTYNSLEKELQNVLSELDRLKPEVHEKMNYDLWRAITLVTYSYEHYWQLLQWWYNPYYGILQPLPASFGSLTPVIPAIAPSDKEYILRLLGYTILKAYPILGTSACFSSSVSFLSAAEVNVGDNSVAWADRWRPRNTVAWADQWRPRNTGVYNSGSAEANVGSHNAGNSGRWRNSLRMTSESASGARNIPRDVYTANVVDDVSSRSMDTSSAYNGQSAQTATTFLEKMKNWWSSVPTIAPASISVKMKNWCSSVPTIAPASSSVPSPSAPPLPDGDQDRFQYPSFDSGESSSSPSCVICWDAPVEGALIPCGHMVGCMACLNELYDCPVCRAKVDRVLRLYAV